MVPHGYGGDGSGNSAAASSVWCATRRDLHSLLPRVASHPLRDTRSTLDRLPPAPVSTADRFRHVWIRRGPPTSGASAGGNIWNAPAPPHNSSFAGTGAGGSAAVSPFALTGAGSTPRESISQVRCKTRILWFLVLDNALIVPAAARIRRPVSLLSSDVRCKFSVRRRKSSARHAQSLRNSVNSTGHRSPPSCLLRSALH